MAGQAALNVELSGRYVSDNYLGTLKDITNYQQQTHVWQNSERVVARNYCDKRDFGLTVGNPTGHTHYWFGCRGGAGKPGGAAGASGANGSGGNAGAIVVTYFNQTSAALSSLPNTTSTAVGGSKSCNSQTGKPGLGGAWELHAMCINCTRTLDCDLGIVLPPTLSGPGGKGGCNAQDITTNLDANYQTKNWKW